MNSAWRLERATDRHRAHPSSFEIPSREERESLGPGWKAKLLFWLPDGEEESCERMWVTISDVVAHGRYRGRLESKPLTPPWEWELGAIVEFDESHVCAAQEVPDWREQLEMLEAFASGDDGWAAYLRSRE